MPDIYSVDIEKLVRWNLRRKKRKPKILALLNACVKPVSILYQTFMQFKKNKLFQIKINSQVVYIERLLNDRWDFTNRGIYIDDPVDKNPFYIYQSAELKPRYIYKSAELKPKCYIYTAGESGGITNDFIVFVPAEVVFNVAEMIGTIKSVKLPGMKFKIQRY